MMKKEQAADKVAVHAVVVIQHRSVWKSWNRVCVRGKKSVRVCIAHGREGG